MKWTYSTLSKPYPQVPLYQSMLAQDTRLCIFEIHCYPMTPQDSVLINSRSACNTQRTQSREWAWHYEAIAIAKRYSNVYLETSAVVAQRFLEMAVKELGADRIVFGTDGPDSDSRLELYKIKLLRLPFADEAKVLGGNIQRLLPKGSV